MTGPLDHITRAIGVPCPKCKAYPGRMCRGPVEGAFDGVHAARVYLAIEGRPPAKFYTREEDDEDDFGPGRYR